MYQRLAVSAFAALALTVGAAAQADVQPGFYAGAAFGSTTIDDDGFDAIGFDDSDTGFKVFGGYDFNPYFAIEASYFDFGEGSGTFDDVILGSFDFDVGVSGFDASAVGTLPVSDSLSVFGKVGVASYDIDAHVTVPGFGSGSESESDMTYGAGVALDFGQFGVRLEYEAINVDDGEASMLSIGGFYRF